MIAALQGVVDKGREPQVPSIATAVTTPKIEAK